MATIELEIEGLELKITEIQKEISIKREILKVELENENDDLIEQLRNDVLGLKERVMLLQADLRKLFLKKGNSKLEVKNNTQVNIVK